MLLYLQENLRNTVNINLFQSFFNAHYKHGRYSSLKNKKKKTKKLKNQDVEKSIIRISDIHHPIVKEIRIFCGKHK